MSMVLPSSAAAVRVPRGRARPERRVAAGAVRAYAGDSPGAVEVEKAEAAEAADVVALGRGRGRRRGTSVSRRLRAEGGIVEEAEGGGASQIVTFLRPRLAVADI